MWLLPDLSAVSQASRQSRIISSIPLDKYSFHKKSIDPFLMCSYSNNSENVMYYFTDHHLKAKLFTLVLNMYRKTYSSNYIGNKELSEGYERIELKSGSGKSCDVL